MRLSTSIDTLEDHYDVVVVGSGYGGAIAASRLSRAGKRVCLLERGREISRGDFPETPEALARELQFMDDTGLNRLGLYDLHADDPLSVVVGCGLGGTSLINANVAIEPDPRIFLDGRWPRAIARDLDALRLGFERARAVLDPKAYPEDWPRLAKLEAHRQSAIRMGHEKDFLRVPINVRFEDGPNAVGFEQAKCTLCGNCASGCNAGAKGALTTNYLPDARAHGATLVTHAQVRFVTREAAGWAVHFVPVEERVPLDRDAPTQFVLADVVVLAAGAIGSTEILLRSKARGLKLSDQVGRHFSGNGDELGFAYETEDPCNGLGWSPGDRSMDPGVGPTITSGIYLHGESVKDDVLIEEGAIPVSLAAAATGSLAVVAAVTAGRIARDLSPEAAAKATQTYLIMSVDDDRGRVELDDGDRARIVWGDLAEGRDLRLGVRHAKSAAEGIRGTYLNDPLWSKWLGRRLVSVHPLGGCAMGDTGAQGAVDDACRVFDSDGQSVHEGLYVCDGSVVPSALGVNPLLTICAVTERAVAALARSRGWVIDYTLPKAGAARAVPAVDPPQNVGLQFNERMTGAFAVGAADFDTGFARGQAAGTTVEIDVTIHTHDLDSMLREPAHAATLSGSASAPSLSPQPLTVTHGVFNLFYEAPERPGLRFMRYRMRLTSVAGKSWWFDGFKHIGNDAPTAALHDSTTLFLTLHEGADETAPVLARGVLRIGAVGVVDLVRSVNVTGAHGFFGRVAAATKFFASFAGAEVSTYLGNVRQWWHPHAPPGPVPPPPPAAKR